MSYPNVEQTLQIAVQHHQAGRLAESETLYRQILAQQPNHFDALHLLGVIVHQAGQNDLAADLIGRAIALNPNLPEAHYHLGNSLRDMGQIDQAIAAYQRAISLKPDLPHVHFNLGNSLKDTGRHAEAVAAYRQAIVLTPGLFEAYGNLGVVLRICGQLDEAIAAFRQAVALQPDRPETYANLGNALQDKNELDEAIAAYRQAINLKPDFFAAYSNLGNALREKGRLGEAIAACHQAIALEASNPDAYNNLGRALKDEGQLELAIFSFRQAIAINPNFPEAYNNLGNALQCKGQLEEAIAAYRQAVSLRPNDSRAHSNIIFALDLMEGADLAQQQEERRRWYEQHRRKFAAAIKQYENEPDPERKLCVGYVSADFRRHSAYCAFAPVICGHDRSAFEVFCYSEVKREDDATARLRHAAHGWRSTLGVSDDALAEQIRRDRIDILVDLSGHSGGNRLLVFTRKPAPIQVTAWGYATGTGLKTMDYFFADPVAVPPQDRALFAEHVIDLPCALCYEPPECVPTISALPALQNNPLTYGCVNRLEKISNRAIALWGRILQGVPGARLLVKTQGFNDVGVQKQFLGRLHTFGQIEISRVLLLGSSPRVEHLKIFHRIDIGLDPFPQNGGISTLDALWRGVPVVALRGSTTPGRISASLLTLIDMRDWVAETDDEYVRIALQAGRDLNRLAMMRQDLPERVRKSPFGDVQSYTRAVEAAYRQMWRKWCATAHLNTTS